MNIIDEYYILNDYGTSRVMVFPIGKFKTSKYPELNLDRSKAEAVIENFNNKVLGATEPFIDSSGRHDEGAPAAGWIKALAIKPWQKGEALFAEVEWTNVGQRLVQDKLYKYLSPVLAPHTIPETGEKVFPVLRSMSLTNIPVLRMMPAIQASEREEFYEIACSELIELEQGTVEEVPQGVNVKEPVETPAVEPEVVVETPAPVAETEEDVTASVVEPVTETEEAPVAESVEEPKAEEPVAEEPKVEDAEIEPPKAEEVDNEDLIAQMMQILSKLDSRVKYKRGAPALRALMKEAIAKARVTAADESDFVNVTDTLQTILAELDESGKEMNTMMDKLIEKFGLTEDATEDDVIALYDAKMAELTEAHEIALAEVQSKLEAVEAEIAETVKAAHVAEVEHRLTEAVSAGLVKPADVGDEENPGWVRKLAFGDEALFDEFLDSRKAPVVDLSERGSGDSDGAADSEKMTDERPDVTLARKGREFQKAHPELSLAEAQNRVRKEDPELDVAYRQLVEETLIRR